MQVVVCKAGEMSSMCSDGSAAATETKGAVYVRPGLTDAQLKVALQVSFHECHVLCKAHLAKSQVQNMARQGNMIVQGACD